MQRILVWDLPTRWLHWALTGSVLGALVLASASDEHSMLFQLHMVLGLVAAFVVLLRIVWGLVGSRYARFASFLFGPAALWRYLRAALRSRGERHVGHNPGSSYAAYAMLLAPLLLGVSGVLATRGSEGAEDLHGPVAHLLVLVVLAHIAGIAWHTVRHRENVALGMVTGRKAGEPAEAIVSAHPIAGLVFVGLCAAVVGLLVAGFDPAGRIIRLPLLGVTLSTGGEDEAHEPGERGEHGEGTAREKSDRGPQYDKDEKDENHEKHEEHEEHDH